MTPDEWDIKRNEIKEHCLNGLAFDGEHHKQWFFEQIIKACGFDLEEVRESEAEDGYEWEPGVAP